MDVRLRHHAWLLSSASGAAAIGWLGLPGFAPLDAETLVTVAAALTVLAVGVALHFRAHARRLAAERAVRRARQVERHRRLTDLAADLQRSQHVIQDNLEEVHANPGSPAASLYVQGVRAHASRLGDLSRRLQHIAAGDEED